MEALASIREIKRSGGKGGEEIFMNFGDIFVAGKKEKVEEQLKVTAAALISRVHVVSLACSRRVTRFYLTVRTSDFHQRNRGGATTGATHLPATRPSSNGKLHMLRVPDQGPNCSSAHDGG